MNRRTSMNLIERHIFRRVLILTLTTLSVTTAIVLMTQLLQRLNVLTQSSDAILSFLSIAVTLIPQMAMIVLPFALLIAVARTLSTMNLDSEMAVIEAAGGSRWTIAKPVLVLSAVLTVLSLLNAHFLEPRMNRSLRDTVNEASADLLSLAVRTGTFTQISDGLFVQISKELPGGVLGGVVIADTREPGTQLIYYAKRGIVRSFNNTKFLQLDDGEVHRKKLDDGELSVITFVSTGLDFSSFGTNVMTGNYLPIEMDTPALLHPDPNYRVYKERPYLVRKEIHRRFSEWLYPLAFGLIGIYFAGGVQSHREDRVWKLAGAAVTAVAIRALGFLATGNSGSSAFFAVLSYLIPIATIILFSLAIALGWKSRFAGRWIERGTMRAQDLLARFQQARIKWSARGTMPEGSGR
jgi:lipopolysaccharide export system permease protein